MQSLSVWVTFLVWCMATVSIHHSYVVFCDSNPEVVKMSAPMAGVFISENVLLSSMLYTDGHKNICVVAP